MSSNIIFKYDWPIKPQNLCPWFVKTSQSNFNLRSPDCYWVCSYLITTVNIPSSNITLVCIQAKWKWKVLFQCARRHILAAAPASAWISGAWSKGDLKEIPVTSRLPLHRSYSAPPSPPCRHCGSASSGRACLSRLLVPWLAAAALMALGARQSPTLAMHGPQTQWPTTLENDKKKEKFRERH